MAERYELPPLPRNEAIQESALRDIKSKFYIARAAFKGISTPEDSEESRKKISRELSREIFKDLILLDQMGITKSSGFRGEVHKIGHEPFIKDAHQYFLEHHLTQAYIEGNAQAVLE